MRCVISRRGKVQGGDWTGVIPDLRKATARHVTPDMFAGCCCRAAQPDRVIASVQFAHSIARRSVSFCRCQSHVAWGQSIRAVKPVSSIPALGRRQQRSLSSMATLTCGAAVAQPRSALATSPCSFLRASPARLRPVGKHSLTAAASSLRAASPQLSTHRSVAARAAAVAHSERDPHLQLATAKLPECIPGTLRGDGTVATFDCCVIATASSLTGLSGLLRPPLRSRKRCLESSAADDPGRRAFLV